MSELEHYLTAMRGQRAPTCHPLLTVCSQRSVLLKQAGNADAPGQAGVGHQHGRRPVSWKLPGCHDAARVTCQFLRNPRHYGLVWTGIAWAV